MRRRASEVFISLLIISRRCTCMSCSARCWGKRARRADCFFSWGDYREARRNAGCRIRWTEVQGKKMKTRGDTSFLLFHLCKHSQVKNTCSHELQDELVLTGHRVAHVLNHSIWAEARRWRILGQPSLASKPWFQRPQVIRTAVKPVFGT